MKLLTAAVVCSLCASLSQAQFDQDLAQATSSCRSSDSLVYCQEAEEVFVSDAESRIVAINIRTRSTKWRADVDVKLASNLVVTSDVVAFATAGGGIWGLARQTGKKVWEVGRRSKKLIGAGNLVLAQTTEREGVVAIDGRTGRTAWRHAGPSRRGPFYLHFFGTDGDVVLTNAFAVAGATGRILQRWPNLPEALPDVADFVGELRVIGVGAELTAYREDSSLAWLTKLPVDGLKQPKLSVAVGSPSGLLALVTDKSRDDAARLMLVSTSGQLVWRRDVPNNLAFLPGPMGVDRQLVFLVVNGGNKKRQTRILALRVGSGEPVWSVEVAEQLVPGGVATCADGRCLVTGYLHGVSSVFSLDTRTGRLESLFRLPW